MKTFIGRKHQRIFGSLLVPVLLAAVSLIGANSFVLSPILSDVAHDLGTEPYHIAWAISVFGALTALSSLILAKLVDRISIGLLMGAAALLLAAASVLSGLSHSWWWLCSSQALSGISTGILLPGAYATASKTAPEGRQASRMAMVMTGWALSLVLIVPLAAFITECFGWRYVYFILAILSVITGISLVVSLQDAEQNSSKRCSIAKAIYLPHVIPILIIIFIYMTAFYGAFSFFGEGMKQRFDFSSQEVGYLVMTYGLGFGLAGVIISIISPKISMKYITLILLGIVFSYSSWVMWPSTFVAILLASFIWGLLNQIALNALIVELNQSSNTDQGVLMGLSTATTYLAVFAGPVIMTPIFNEFGFIGVSTFAALLVSAGTFFNIYANK
ncbi:MFS transporter [Klebsiella sp. S69]|uniref:MFS transporter n=1 Tax=Klebsiella sp. S69 TaxID=2767439 RepID=UPI0019072CB4|nr:MFS transporter [Klebsiella sp. S69]MBK0167413.1 MFS transporter [Klebsiella sp. S69]